METFFLLYHRVTYLLLVDTYGFGLESLTRLIDKAVTPHVPWGYAP